MWIHTTHDNKLRGQNESTVSLVFASHMATIAGVVIAVFVSFLLLWIMVPGYLASRNPSTELSDAPSNIIHDKTEGLSFHVYFAATVINFSVGSFVGIILPFYSKRNQTKDSREPVPLENKGVKR
jgi:Na+/H+ antiporter NhaD/arsenite permease-like protein